MSERSKKAALIGLVVFTVLAIATIAGVIILNGRFAKEAAAEPVTVTAEQVTEVKKPETPAVKTQQAPAKETQKPAETPVKAEVKTEQSQTPAPVAEEEKGIMAALKLKDSSLSGFFYGDHAELDVTDTIDDEYLEAIAGVDGVTYSRAGKKVFLNYPAGSDVKSLIFTLQDAADAYFAQPKFTDPYYEDFEMVEHLDLYGYDCVITSTDGKVTITYPSDIVPVEYLLYLAKQVADAYPEEVSHVTFSLEPDLIVLSFPTTFTEFDVWLYQEVLTSDIPIFASWLMDGTYVLPEKEEVKAEEPIIIEPPKTIAAPEVPAVPVTPVVTSVSSTEAPSEEEVPVTVAEIEEEKPVKEKSNAELTAKLSLGYALNGSNPLGHGISIGAGLNVDNIVVFDRRFSLGLGFDGGLNFYAVDLLGGQWKKNIWGDVTLNLTYKADDRFSISLMAGARVFVNRDSVRAGMFSVGDFNVHIGAVAGLDLRYRFNELVSIGLDARYAFIMGLPSRLEARAYVSFTF
ncbi:MAG: hypothetical protein ACI4NM_04530 [Bullifex sp.]